MTTGLKPQFFTTDMFDCPPLHLLTLDDCPRARNILIDKEFEPTSMRLWCHLAKSATSILDIGAHVGIYALSAASLRPDLAVHAFEPNPWAYTRLREHIRLNGFTNIAEHHVALCYRTGMAPFSWAEKPGNPISSGGSIGYRGQGCENTFVMGDILDGFKIPYGDRPLIKIDVEGGEREVFEGGTQMFKSRPDIILETFSWTNAKAIWDLLPDDYISYVIEEKSGRLVMGEKLRSMDQRGQNFNQFLTVRPLPDGFV